MSLKPFGEYSIRQDERTCEFCHGRVTQKMPAIELIQDVGVSTPGAPDYMPPSASFTLRAVVHLDCMEKELERFKRNLTNTPNRDGSLNRIRTIDNEAYS